MGGRLVRVTRRDLKRLEKITEEAIHPKKPSPGHAVGCPCHRCRMYRDGLKKPSVS